jgi:hypothetical protein
MRSTVIMAVLVCVCATGVGAAGTWILREREMYVPANSPSTAVRQLDRETPWHLVSTFMSEEECRQSMEDRIKRHRTSLDQHGHANSRRTAASGIESLVSEIPDLKDEHMTQYHCTPEKP